MEMDIHTSAPQGSPILAYGSSSTSAGPWLKIVLMSLIALLFVLPLCFALLATVPLPKDAFLVAMIRGGQELPDAFPHTWRAAARGTRLPLLVGLSLQDGKAVPFAIIPRTGDAQELLQRKQTFFAQLSETSLPEGAKTRAGQFLLPALSSLRHTAYLRLDTAPFGENPETHLAGPVDGTVWNTNKGLEGIPSLDLPPGDLSLNIAAFPGSWPKLQATLAAQGQDIPDQPQALALSLTTSSINGFSLDYAERVPEATALGLMSSMRLYDTETVTLPDGSLLQALNAPAKLFAASQNQEWPVQGSSTLAIHGGRISLQPSSSTAALLPDACVPGQRLAFFSPTALANLLQAWKVEMNPNMMHLDVIQRDDRLVFCVH